MVGSKRSGSAYRTVHGIKPPEVAEVEVPRTLPLASWDEAQRLIYAGLLIGGDASLLMQVMLQNGEGPKIAEVIREYIAEAKEQAYIGFNKAQAQSLLEVIEQKTEEFAKHQWKNPVEPQDHFGRSVLCIGLAVLFILAGWLLFADH
jgi:hypothetical protein